MYLIIITNLDKLCKNIILIISSTVQVKEIVAVKSLPQVLLSKTQLVPMFCYNLAGQIMPVLSCFTLPVDGQLKLSKPLEAGGGRSDSL